MSIFTIDHKSTRPPIALTSGGPLHNVATRLGLALLTWAKASEARRADQLTRRQERLVHQAEFDRLIESIADRQANIESTIALRALR